MRSDALLSVVIPVYRSEAYLGDILRELIEFLSPRVKFEMILVNDGSPDNVQRMIDQLATNDQRIRGVTLGRNAGQHRAVLVGFTLARGDVVVTVDDDGQNPPEAVWAVAEALAERDLDVVYGGFQSVENTGIRKLASGVNRWLSSSMLQNRDRIALSNVRALRGDLARAMGAARTPYPYIDAMVFRMTQHIGQVSIAHRARGRGASTYTLSRLLRLWLSHLTTLSVTPLFVAMIGCFGVSAMGLALGVAQVFIVLSQRLAPPGWLSLFVAVTFLFSVLFAYLGIVSIYLGRMYVGLNEQDMLWIRTPAGGVANRAPSVEVSSSDIGTPVRAGPGRQADEQSRRMS